MALLFEETARIKEYDSLWSSGRNKINLIYDVEDATKRGVQLAPTKLSGSMIVGYDLGDVVTKYNSFETETIEINSAIISYKYRSSDDGLVWSAWKTVLSELSPLRFLQVCFEFSRTSVDDYAVLQYTKITYTISTGQDIPTAQLMSLDEQAINVDAKVTVETRERKWTDATEISSHINFAPGLHPWNSDIPLHAFDVFKKSDTELLLAYARQKSGGYEIYVRTYNPLTGAVGAESLPVTGGNYYDIRQPFRINYFVGGQNGAQSYWVVYGSKDGHSIVSAYSPNPWGTAWQRETIFDGTATATLDNKYIARFLTNGGMKSVYLSYSEEDNGLLSECSFTGAWTKKPFSNDNTYCGYITTATDTSCTISFEGTQLWLAFSAFGYHEKYTTMTVYYREHGTSTWKRDKAYCYDKSNLLERFIKVFAHNVYRQWDVKMVFKTSENPNEVPDCVGILGPASEGYPVYQTNIDNAPNTTANFANWLYSRWTGRYSKLDDCLYLGCMPGVKYYSHWQMEYIFKQTPDTPSLSNCPSSYVQYSKSAWARKCTINRIKFRIKEAFFDDTWLYRIFVGNGSNPANKVFLDPAVFGGISYVQFPGQSSNWSYWKNKTVNIPLGADSPWEWWGLQIIHTPNAFWQGIGHWMWDYYKANDPNIPLFHMTIDNIIIEGTYKEPFASWVMLTSIAVEGHSTSTTTSKLNFVDAFVCDLRDSINYDWIREWLMIGYWDGFESADAALSSANQVNGTNNPKSGLVENEKTWTRWLSTNNTYYNFRDWWTGEPGPTNCVAWSCVYVYNPTSENIDTQLTYGCDDGIRIYVLGETDTSLSTPIAQQTGERALKANEFSCNVTFKPGWNRIYVKSSNGSIQPNRWGFQISVVDAATKGLIINTNKSISHDMLAIAFQAPFQAVPGTEFQWHEGDNAHTGEEGNWYFNQSNSHIEIKTKGGVNYNTGWQAQFRWTKPSEMAKIGTVEFDYDCNIPSGWEVRVCDQNETARHTFVGSGKQVGNDYAVNMSGGTNTISFRLYRSGGAISPPDGTVYMRISNIRVYYLTGGKNNFLHCRLNWGGNALNWSNPYCTKQYILWDDAWITVPTSCSFFEVDGVLYCYASHTNDSGKCRLVLYTLNSSLSLESDAWEWKTVRQTLFTPPNQTYYKYLNVGVDIYNRFHITANLHLIQSGVTTHQNRFFYTYHPEFVGSAIVSPGDEIILAFVPVKDKILAFTSKKSPNNLIYRRELYTPEPVPTDISKFVNSLDISRDVKPGSDTMSLALFTRTATDGLVTAEESISPYDVSSRYNWIVPKDNFDRKPRIVRGYLARFSPDETPSYDSIFAGILGPVSESMARNSEIIDIEVVGLSHQLNKFNSPETYLYASPTHVWLDNFVDEYDLILTSTQHIKPQTPLKNKWISGASSFEVDPEMAILRNKHTTASTIVGKAAQNHTNIALACSICLADHKAWQLWLAGHDNALYLEYNPTTYTLMLKKNGVGTLKTSTLDMSRTTKWYDISIHYYRTKGIIYVYVDGSKKMAVSGQAIPYTSYSFKWVPTGSVLLKSPRLLRIDTGDFEKTDWDIAKDVIYKASQGIIPVQLKAPAFKNVLVGFIFWKQGESALSFLERLAKMFNCRFYFDRKGVFIWEPNVMETTAVDITGSVFKSFSRSYSGFDYTNWIEVRSDKDNNIYKADAADEESVAHDGIRYKLVEEGNVESNKEAKLRALKEYYSELEGLETASVTLVLPLYEIEPTTTLNIYYPEKHVNGLFFVNGLRINYNKGGKEIEISLDLDSRIRAQRGFLARTYEGGLVRYEQ